MSTVIAMTSTTPTSPTSPTRKRRSLRIPSFQSQYDPPSPSVREYSQLDMSLHSRRSSQSSQQRYPPITPRSKRPSSSRLSIGSNISTGLTSNAGFGNLADELEEAWDPDYDTQDGSFLEGLQEGDPDHMLYSPVDTNVLYDQSRVMTPQSPRTSRHLNSPEKPQSPSKQWADMGIHRKTESLYDGSNYGPSSDDEAFDSIPPTLQRRIHDMEEITRISKNADALSESGSVISRTTAALRDNLGAQSAIESFTTRLITAYASMATHRSYQTRELSGAMHALSSSGPLGLSLYDLPSEEIDLIISEIDALILTLPFLPVNTSSVPAAPPLNTLQAFANSTHDLSNVLHNLADTLTEHRQHILMSTRRLKTVRQLVDELVKEEELLETSMLLIQAGDWDRRCRERHAGKAVTEVLEGFKKTWDVDYVEGAWKPTTTSRREISVQ